MHCCTLANFLLLKAGDGCSEFFRKAGRQLGNYQSLGTGIGSESWPVWFPGASCTVGAPCSDGGSMPVSVGTWAESWNMNQEVGLTALDSVGFLCLYLTSLLWQKQSSSLIFAHLCPKTNKRKRRHWHYFIEKVHCSWYSWVINCTHLLRWDPLSSALKVTTLVYRPAVLLSSVIVTTL